MRPRSYMKRSRKRGSSTSVPKELRLAQAVEARRAAKRPVVKMGRGISVFCGGGFMSGRPCSVCQRALSWALVEIESATGGIAEGVVPVVHGAAAGGAAPDNHLSASPHGRVISPPGRPIGAGHACPTVGRRVVAPAPKSSVTVNRPLLTLTAELVTARPCPVPPLGAS
jgi:hypothetical protein